MSAAALDAHAHATRLVVELHPGSDLQAYVDGHDDQVPLLCLETDLVFLLISLDAPTVSPAAVTAAEIIAEAAVAFRDRLRGLVAR